MSVIRSSGVSAIQGLLKSWSEWKDSLDFQNRLLYRRCPLLRGVRSAGFHCITCVPPCIDFKQTMISSFCFHVVWSRAVREFLSGQPFIDYVDSQYYWRYLQWKYLEKWGDSRRGTPLHIWPRSRLLGELFMRKWGLFSLAVHKSAGTRLLQVFICSPSIRSQFEVYSITDGQLTTLAITAQNMFQ